MNTELSDTIKRKIIHIRSRPTKYNVNNLYILLKNIDSLNAPKIKQGEYTYENIIKFCDDTEKFITKGNFKDNYGEESVQKKYVYVKLEESFHLPNNIYFVEKDDDDIIDEAPLNIDDIDISDSDQELDVEDDADDYYESDDGEYSLWYISPSSYS